MAVYSFLDVTGSLTGPGATAIPLASGSGAADEGITTTPGEDKNTATYGADGALMHSLHAARPGRWTVRLLKTSPVNNQLQALYNLQSTSSALWGQNVLTITNAVAGDFLTLTEAAFVKQPDVVFAKDGNTNEWEFQGKVHQNLGAGSAIPAGVV